MKKLTCTITCCLLCLTAYLQEKPEWQDETIPFVGKEYPQTSFMTYGDTDKARKNDFKISADYKSLNGKWKFNWVPAYKNMGLDRPRHPRERREWHTLLGVWRRLRGEHSRETAGNERGGE